MEKHQLEKLDSEKRDSGRPLVLVIEDDPIQQRLYELIKDKVNMVPCVVASCAEGLEAVQLIKFNLIVLDLQLPDMSGLECAKKMRDRNLNLRTPILAVTARAMESDQRACLAAGMDDYLSKPFTLDQLRNKVEQLAIPDLNAPGPESGCGQGNVRV